jgi:hypothetical protein
LHVSSGDLLPTVTFFAIISNDRKISIVFLDFKNQILSYFYLKRPQNTIKPLEALTNPKKTQNHFKKLN